MALVAVVAAVAELAVPVKLPTNVVAVIEFAARFALIPVLITADELPLADEVVNVGYAVVAADVFCSKAAAFVALGTVLTLAPLIDARFAPDSPAANVADEPIKLFQVPEEILPTAVMFGCDAVVRVPLK